MCFLHKFVIFRQNKSMKKQTFLGGVAILFLAGILAKFIGAIYRVPLTWILGAEGLGIYQLVFPIFSLLMVISSAGMPTAISKMVANALSKNDFYKARKILKVSVIYLSIIGLLFSIILIGLAQALAGVQGHSESVICYYAIAPAIFFVSILSAFRGYFQGYSNMIPTALSQIIEQVVKLVLGLILSYALVRFGIEYGALGAILGVTISEVVAVLVLGGIYLKDRKQKANSAQNGLYSTMHSTYEYVKNAILKQNKVNLVKLPATEVVKFRENHNFSKIHSFSLIQNSVLQGSKVDSRELAKELFKTSLPIILASITLPLLVFIESILVIRLLGNAGLDVAEATTLWGLSSGVVTSLTNMPIMLSLAVAISLVPAIAGATQKSVLAHKLNQSITLVLAFCLPLMLGIMILGEPIIELLYQDSLGGIEYSLLTRNLLICASITIPFGAVLQVQNSALQGAGYGKITMLNMLLSGVFKIAMFILLVQVPAINIWGSVISNIAFYILAFLFNYLFIRFKLKIKFSYKNLLPSLAGGVLMALFIGNLEMLLANASIFIKLPIEILFGAILYMFGLYVFGAFKDFDLAKIKQRLNKSRLNN